MNNILLVFLGGGIGSLARYGVSQIVWHNFKSAFPVATLTSNIIATLILALTVGYFAGRATDNTAMKIFIVTGICGGFSTFSTFSYETAELFRTGNTVIAITNILISVAVCVALAFFISKQA
jgi:CrcB protein